MHEGIPQQPRHHHQQRSRQPLRHASYLTDSRRQATGRVVDVAVPASSSAARLHAGVGGLIYCCCNRNVVTAVAHDNHDTLVIVCNFNLAIKSGLRCAITHCRLRRFSFARLVSGDPENAIRHRSSDRSPPAFPLRRWLLGRLLLPIAWDRRANNRWCPAIVVIDGARWTKPALGMRGAGTQQPQTNHQQPVQEMSCHGSRSIYIEGP